MIRKSSTVLKTDKSIFNIRVLQSEQRNWHDRTLYVPFVLFEPLIAFFNNEIGTTEDNNDNIRPMVLVLRDFLTK